MSENQTTTSSGSGLAVLLFIVFLILKLTGVIDWRWIWVLSPIWLPIAFSFGIMGIAVIVAHILNKL